MPRPMFKSAAAVAAVFVACLATCSRASRAGGFYEDFDVIWDEEHVRVTDDGGRRQVVTLTLDNASGSGFQSKDQFLFGEFAMEMKLVPGDSAGTVATFYLTSEGDAHDEIDFEFLGNVSGEPYVMHTNVFVQGTGNREQEFYLWFDPTADFHNYTVLWNPNNIIWTVDGVPVRVFKNHESSGVPYLGGQAMRVHASLWNGESWATQGGRVKTNWSDAPFVASYGSYAYAATACVAGDGASSGCPPNAAPGDAGSWMDRQLGPDDERAIAWARENYMIYDYCNDPWRFPQGRPAECNLDRHG
ncbi:xyloglucan endotransglucosylase protein 7-like [Phragmites australis]|uniref:xyloglucan endotransglucosylase protein 7-like n=1 Tax=Phragmites australis TaxID=29695 RepID=UPI002D776295|nr:xyloglucan endotransglucosylase protein 7-like [Phragmites australis]